MEKIFKVLKSNKRDSINQIIIPIHNWSSQIVSAYVIGGIFEAMGLNVRYENSDSQAVYEQIRLGQVHIAHEVWESAFGRSFENAKRKGGLLDWGDHEAKTIEDMGYPNWVAELPEVKAEIQRARDAGEYNGPGLPDWKVFRDTNIYKFFTTPDSPNGKGRWLEGPQTWHGNVIPERVEALGLDKKWWVKFAGSADALWAELSQAKKEKRGTIIFNWSPNFTDREGFTFIKFPDYYQGCRPEDGGDGKCGSPYGYLKKAVNETWTLTHPDAADVFKKLSFTTKQLGTMAALVDLDKMTHEDAANKWLNDNRDVWMPWIRQAVNFTYTPAPPSQFTKGVTVASWGGAYTESQKLGYGNPTAKKLGIPINWVDYSGGLSEIKAQKEAGKITWDIIDVYAKDTIIGCDEGIFHEFDFDKDFPPAPDGTPASEDFFISMPSKCAVGNILYSWNFAYNDATIGKKKPKTIKDFFNTRKFPGKRAIYKGAMSNLEFAISALGVNPGQGSDLTYIKLSQKGEIDRAINKIKELGEDPNGGLVFWNAGAQPPELLANGEVVMATGWNGRFFNAQMEGTPLVQIWDSQIIDYEYFSLVKDGPGYKNGNSLKVLAEMTSTEMLAGSAKYIAYAPWRKSSIKYIEEQEKLYGPWYKDRKTYMLPHMPTAPQNLKRYILMNPDFWADYQDEINEKWAAMKVGLY